MRQRPSVSFRPTVERFEAKNLLNASPAVQSFTAHFSPAPGVEVAEVVRPLESCRGGHASRHRAGATLYNSIITIFNNSGTTFTDKNFSWIFLNRRETLAPNVQWKNGQTKMIVGQSTSPLPQTFTLNFPGKVIPGVQSNSRVATIPPKPADGRQYRLDPGYVLVST